jgi:hypothetical protein
MVGAPFLYQQILQTPPSPGADFSQTGQTVGTFFMATDDIVPPSAYIDYYGYNGSESAYPYSIAVVTVTPRTAWVDFQGFLAGRAKARWPRGKFAFTFTELAELTKTLKSFGLADLLREISRQRKLRARSSRLPACQARSDLYILYATLTVWSFRGLTGTMTTFSTLSGTNSPPKRSKKSLPANTRSGEPVKSYISPWAKRLTAG